MSSSSAYTKLGRSVVAITKDEGMLKAIELRNEGGDWEVLWAKSTEANGDFSAFASECGLITGVSRGRRPDRKKAVTVGFGSAGVAFYHIESPKVSEEDAAAIVKTQAENLLPLPAEQIEVAWRIRSSVNGKTGITFAAAKKELLQKFVESVRCLDPDGILLNCEAVVKAWRVFFRGVEKTAVVVSLGARNTQVCLAEGGQLTSAVILDVGIEDFPEEPGGPDDSGEALLPEHCEIADRFCQDMRSVLVSFGFSDAKDLLIAVLSDGGVGAETVAACLQSVGMNAMVVLPDSRKIRGSSGIQTRDLYEYRVPLGLAAMSLDESTEGLRLFDGLYKTAGEERNKHGLYSSRVAGVIAIVMLAVLILTAYLVDVASHKRLSTIVSQSSFKDASERYKLMKVVAQQRPDLMDLLDQVNSSEGKGIALDSLVFKKGQLVTITGQAQSNEQIYEFQKFLLGRNGIKDVNIQHAVRSEKDKKVKFTMTFNYKQFTRKNTGL